MIIEFQPPHTHTRTHTHTHTLFGIIYGKNCRNTVLWPKKYLNFFPSPKK